MVPVIYLLLCCVALCVALAVIGCQRDVARCDLATAASERDLWKDEHNRANASRDFWKAAYDASDKSYHQATGKVVDLQEEAEQKNYHIELLRFSADHWYAEAKERGEKVKSLTRDRDHWIETAQGLADECNRYKSALEDLRPLIDQTCNSAVALAHKLYSLEIFNGHVESLQAKDAA